MNPLAAVRDAAWLTADRARAYGRLLSVALAVSAVWIMAARFQYTGAGQRPVDDFLTFLAAGDMMRHGQAAAAYHMDAFTAALSHYAVMGTGRLPFLYPPIMLVVCGWMANLPETLAYFVFESVTLIPLLVCLYDLLPKRWAILPIVAAPAVLMNFGSGQTGFFPAAAYAMAAVLMEKRPALAGAALGLLLFKPHFALLVPLALACAGQWRAFIACGATAAGLALASLAFLPVQAWVSFFSQQGLARTMLEHGTNILLSVDPVGALRAAGAPLAAAYSV
jgi:alpha-1,2-mannosyltransferase